MFVLCSASSTSSSTYSFGLFVTNLLCWKCWSCSPRQTLSSHEILVVLCLGRAREGKTEREPGPVTNALESWKQLAEVAKREGRDLLPFRNPHLFVQIFLSLRRIHKLSKTGDSHLQALLGFRKTRETGAGFSAQDKGKPLKTVTRSLRPTHFFPSARACNVPPCLDALDMGDGAQDVLQSGDWQKVYLISGTSYTCHLSVVRKPAAANLSKTSFSSPLNVSLLYLILGALPQVPKYRQWILEGRARREMDESDFFCF